MQVFFRALFQIWLCWMSSLCTSASECFQLVLKFSLSFHFPQPAKLVSGTTSLQLFHFPAQSCGDVLWDPRDSLSWKQTHTMKQRGQICSAPGVSCSLLSVLFPLTYCSTLSTLMSCCFHSKGTVWNFIFVFGRSAGTQLLLQKNGNGSAPAPVGCWNNNRDRLAGRGAATPRDLLTFFPFQPHDGL